MKHSARKGRVRVASASGQALVPALVFLLLGVIGLYAAFSSFQMTSSRIKLQNTADAAAYSAATLQARDYNFSAYTNRAMVANQVTAAQVVALKSWIDNLDATYKTSDVDDFVNGIADHPELWSTPKNTASIEIQAVRSALVAQLPTIAAGIGRINRALSQAQTGYHAAVFTAVPDLADAVAQANQADTHVTSGYFTSDRNATQLAAWKTYTKVVLPSGTSGADAFADVVTHADTLDDFTKSRGSSYSVAPNIQQLDDSAAIACGEAGATVSVRIAHDGGTQLRSDKRGWESIDASTAHMTVSCVGPIDGIAGSGAGVSGNIGTFMARPPYVSPEDWRGYGGYFNFGFKGSDQPGWQVPDAMAQQFTIGPGESLDARNGELMPYQDVDGKASDMTAPRITIEVERSTSSLVQSAGARGGPRLKSDSMDAGKTMRALSSANAYFVRPDEADSSLPGALLHAASWSRTDGQREYPSLFSPYWQVRLAQVSDAERDAAIQAQIPVKQ